jgi:hypothetical protein
VETARILFMGAAPAREQSVIPEVMVVVISRMHG